MSSRTIATNDNLLQVFNKYDVQAECYLLGHQLWMTGSILKTSTITNARLYNVGPLRDGCYLFVYEIVATNPTTGQNYFRNGNSRIFVTAGSISTITAFGGATNASTAFTPPATDITFTGVGTNTLIISLGNISNLDATYNIRAVGTLDTSMVTVGYTG